MFEKEAVEYLKKEGAKSAQIFSVMLEEAPLQITSKQIPYIFATIAQAFQDGAEYGYNKAKEDVKHDLMMKLKDEGIVKPLKDSIFRNERLSSQEQQELCAWIECAMEFGEKLDKCAKELEEAKELLKRWVDDKPYTVSEQKDLIADTEQFLKEAE